MIICFGKNVPFDPVFFSWFQVIKTAPFINCSRNPKSLIGLYFFKFEIRKLGFFFSKKSVFFFMFTCVH